MTALPTRSCASSCRRWRTFPFPERPDIVGLVERSATRQSPALFSAGCLRLSPEFTRPTTSRRRPPLNAVGAQRRKTVEPDRGVARCVGAGRQDLDLVADLKPERQLIFRLLVQDIATVPAEGSSPTFASTLRYRVRKPPPLWTMRRLMSASASRLNISAAAPIAPSHCERSVCCEPTWNETP